MNFQNAAFVRSFRYVIRTVPNDLPLVLNM